MTSFDNNNNSSVVTFFDVMRLQLTLDHGGGGGGASPSGSDDDVQWTTTQICITFFMCLGVVTNSGALVFLFCKSRSSMFHRLLKILAISDLVVDICCGILWGMPR